MYRDLVWFISTTKTYVYFVVVSLSCSWKEFIIPMQKLCSGDWDRTLKFTVYDWNKLVVCKSLLFTFIICANLVLYKFCTTIFQSMLNIIFQIR